MRIKDLCTFICSGGTPKRNIERYYSNGTIPWLNTKEIDFNRIRKTETLITREGLESSSAKWITPHAVIIAMYGATAGKAYISEIALTTNQACCNLIIDENIADYRYVYYWFKHNYSHIALMANGGAQQNLSVKTIKELEIELPDIETQKTISNILSSIDNKIENNSTINDYLAA